MTDKPKEEFSDLTIDKRSRAKIAEFAKVVGAEIPGDLSAFALWMPILMRVMVVNQSNLRMGELRIRELERKVARLETLLEFDEKDVN